jgi:hypothetical protein
MKLKPQIVLIAAMVSFGCVAPFASLGDHSAQIEKSIKQKAAFDFGCTEDKLQMQKMDAPMGMYSYGVTGCGKKAPYNGGCDNLGSCNAARAGEIQSAQ